MRMIPSAHNHSNHAKKEKNHEEVEGNPVDGGHHSGSDKHGGRSAYQLLLIR